MSFSTSFFISIQEQTSFFTENWTNPSTNLKKHGILQGDFEANTMSTDIYINRYEDSSTVVKMNPHLLRDESIGVKG